MRILLVTSMVPDATGVGAIPKLLHAQLAGLRERHEVTLLAPIGEDPGQAEAAEQIARSDLDSCFVDRRRSRAPLRRWEVRARLAANWATKGWPWRVVCGSGGIQPALDQLAYSREFDVIAIEDNPVSVLRTPPSLPTVLTEHEAVRAPASDWRGDARPWAQPLRVLQAADWRRWDSFLPSAWRRFDLFQVFSDGDAAAIARQAPDMAARVRVNPYGMVIPPAADLHEEAPGTILFTGTFTHLPNRDAAAWLATEILPAVRIRVPGARLRIVGSSPPPEVLALTGPAVEVIADAPSVAPHLAAAAVVAAPVRSGGGMRMKVLEALALGKAVVTTSLGAEGFTGFGAQPPIAVAEDRAGIAMAIADLLADDATRHGLGARARAFAKRHHSPQAWAGRLEAVYEEARGERSR
jgi:glycosyltransferase involved in cell wall biosynthesis